MIGVVEDGLLRGKQFCVSAKQFSAVRVSVKARKVAAGDFEPDAMAALEEIAGDPKINLERLCLARLEQEFPGRAVPVARADDAIAQVVGLSVRVHVRQLGGKIRIART